MSLSVDPVLQPGSTVLVTAANGLVGSHVVDQCLAYGYKVRAAVRDPEKSKWMQEHFDTKYGPGKLEIIQVKDFAGPYDEAMKGVAGVAHVALVFPTNGDPNKIVQPTVDGVLNALRAAAKEPSIKRFVFTSSAAAVCQTSPGSSGTLTSDMWNEDAVQKAWTPPFTEDKLMFCYAASKVAAEKAMFKFVEEEKPNFAANSIVVPFTLGSRVSHAHQGHPSSTGMALAFLRGEPEFMMQRVNSIHPLYFCNTTDIGLAHLLGLIHPKFENERLFPWAEEVNGNDLLAAFRKIFPQKQIMDDDPALQKCSGWTIEGRKKSEEGLKDLGRPGYVSFEQSMQGVAEGVE